MTDRGWFTGPDGVRRHGVEPAGDSDWVADKQLSDYFDTPEFKMRHVNQHLATIANALNALEREGWELRDGEFTLSAATALPFGPKEGQSEYPNPLVWYDVERNEWRSDRP